MTTSSTRRAAASQSTMYQSIGRLTIGTAGLGIVEVSGRSRVPWPPDRMTACTDVP